MRRQREKEYLRVRADTGQHRRILGVGLFLGIVVLALVVFRLYDLMVNQHSYYADLALRNQSRTTAITANRGMIYDTNMNVLAYSQTVEDVYLNPRELRQSGADVTEIAQQLGDILDRPPEWIAEQARDLKLRYKKIASGIQSPVAAEIRAYINENEVSGIHLEPSSERVYPNGTLAAHIIGFTNASNTGSEGIEAAYDAYLSGTAGRVVTTKGNNEMDMPFSFEKYLASGDGCSVILTLDTTVQECLENRMQEAIEKFDVKNGAFGIVMDVNTGGILAMASLDNYDPNDYQQIENGETRATLEEMRLQLQNAMQSDPEAEKAYREALTAARLKQWRNRCISDGYEPGSTFKVLTLAAALDCGAVTLDTSFYCGGAEQIPGRSQRLHCWRSTGHGAEKTPQALQNSCNLAFAHIGLKLGGERFYQYIQSFGILEKTGIDLLGESGGVFFDENIIKNTDKWGTASLTSAAFGQTFKLTPIQLVRGIAAVVNGGVLMEPYVVSEVINSQGQTVLKQEPTATRRVISEETSEIMCDLLKSVVEEGTAKNAGISGFSIGGKTGTSEKIDIFDENGQRVTDKIVSFVGIAPMDDPRYIVLVALDTPSKSTGIYISGGVMAAPTVGAVLKDILPYLGVLPESDPQTQVRLEDLTGLTVEEATQILQAQGLTPCGIGSGHIVTAQIPSPGEWVSAGNEVILYLGKIEDEGDHYETEGTS